MQPETCPFCSYEPSSYESLVKHVSQKHSGQPPYYYDGAVCFCGSACYSAHEDDRGRKFVGFHKHCVEHGGLHAHAQDFLMGVTAKEES